MISPNRITVTDENKITRVSWSTLISLLPSGRILNQIRGSLHATGFLTRQGFESPVYPSIEKVIPVRLNRPEGTVDMSNIPTIHLSTFNRKN